MALTIELNGVVYPAVEGDHKPTDDYSFQRLLVARIPYDREYLPSQALAVSERFQLLFVADPSGFVVARILDVMLTHLFAEERSLRSSSMVEVPVGRVRLLSLSPESSTLAACVGGTVNLFSVESLNRRVREPLFSPTIDEESSVKDVSWLNEDSYILLSSCGKLYVGRMNRPLEFLMDNVDAVDCSPGFDYIAVARNDELRILPPGLNEESHITLSLQPWTGNSDDFCVKVDSLKWACPDRIILGCFQLTSDGMEESYLLLVIGLTIREILELSVAYVQFFRDVDVFPRIVEDIMPAGSGPHLFFSCLRNHNFAIAANRKNVVEHVVLFDWRHREQMAFVCTDRDYWLPRIELQENDDDNSILGLCISEMPQDPSHWMNCRFRREQNQMIPLENGNRICILWCVSLEGKLSAFIVARREPLELKP